MHVCIHILEEPNLPPMNWSKTACHVSDLQIYFGFEEEYMNTFLLHLSQFRHFYLKSMLISDLSLLPEGSVKPECRSNTGRCTFTNLTDAFSL